MSSEQETTVMETVGVLMAEAFSGDGRVLSSVVDDISHSGDETIDLTDGPTSATFPRVEALEKDQGIDQSLIDEALRRSSSILSDGRDRSDQLVESAQALAVAMVGGAEDTAAVLLEEARLVASRIEEEADQVVLDAVEAAREEYRAKATEVTNQAIADARLLVVNAEEQKQEIVERTRVKTERMLTAVAWTIDEKESHAKEMLSAITSLADTRLAEAEKRAAAVVKQARIDAAAIQDQSEQEARDLRRRSQADADRLLTDAQAQADEVVASVEALKATAHSRLLAAAAEAAERGAASGREKIEAELIDTRREIRELEALAAARREELTEEKSPMPDESAVVSQLTELVSSHVD
jgi:hypothetical protein